MRRPERSAARGKETLPGSRARSGFRAPRTGRALLGVAG